MLNILEGAYKDANWILNDDFDSREAFERSLYSLDMTSSPGLPYMREAPTIGQWLGWKDMEFNKHQVDRLWYDVQMVLAGRWETKLRAFIKMEPHKVSKITEERWRLIMAFPLCVQVVWHMLFDAGNKRLVEKAFGIPSQHGITLVGGDWKLYRRLWISLGFNVGKDKSAWDWTMPYWMILLCLTLRYRLGRGRRMREWLKIAEMLYSDAFEHPLIVLRDGTILKQMIPGIMKSGSVNTISDNGFGQVIVHILVCQDEGKPIYPLPRVCGDDELSQEEQCSDVRSFAKYGIIVKSASSGLEFVGHDFKESGPAPLYIEKHVFKAQYVEETVLVQYLDAMCRMYCHTQWFWFWSNLAIRLGKAHHLYSREYYLNWYDWSE